MLRGRRTEQTTIDALLDGTREGRSGALIIRGEPGIGKTALLDYAAGRAEGMRILRGLGVESEAELPFAGLHLLLRPTLDGLDALPDPPRLALSGAFGLGTGPGTGGDRFMVGAGVLSLLAQVAEPEPLLCLVDDAQWLDRASAEALLFAARRLEREAVVILFAVRDYTGALTSAGIPELRLRGLDAESAAALLDDSGHVVPAAVREQLVAETQGNPLALLELPALIATRGSQPGPLPLTGAVFYAFHHQVRSLPAATRTCLLPAAADDTGDVSALLEAAASLGTGLADLQPAEEHGLVAVHEKTLTFRHPLIRAAVYHGASLGQRVAAHEALAEAYARRADADRHAWHLALAATGPDEEVAAGLADVAARAAGRRAYAAAATAYERAAQLSVDPSGATQRLTAACEAGLSSGRLDWARSRAEQILPDVSDRAIRLRLIDTLAAAYFGRGSLDSAHDLLTNGARLIAEQEPVRAFWMVLDAVHATWAQPTDQKLMAGTVDQFGELKLGPDDPLTAVAWLVRWGTAVALDRDHGDFPPLAQIMPVARAAAAAAGPRGLLRVGTMAFATGQDEEAAGIAALLVRTARADGLIHPLPGGLGHLALTQVLLGRHREALVNGTEAVRIACDTGQPLWASYASGALAYLAAIEGDERRCREWAAEAESGGPDQKSSAGGTWARAALALLDLGAGRVQDAYDRLEAIVDGPTRHQGGVLRCVPDLVEAAVRLGRPESAAGPLERYAAWAGAVRQPWSDAVLARCQALIAPDAGAEPHYARGLAQPESGTLPELGSRPFERARTELAYGEWLRRSRRKNEARTHLNAALRGFAELGSAPWAARARTELGATGAALPRAVPSDAFANLTPQEVQIAQLAAEGLSNRDIAARLFLSPRTVAYHLYKAYPKLGISSRGELASLAQR